MKKCGMWLAFTACAVSVCVFAAVDGVEEASMGEPIRFTATDHLIFSNARNPSLPDTIPTNLFMNENSPRVEWGNYSAGIHFTNQFTTNGPQEQNAPFQLAKAYAAADLEDWQIRLGDSYLLVGKGIALSLYQNPTFGLDNTLQGGLIRFHPRGLDTEIFAGRINTMSNPVAINPVADPLTGRSVYLGGGSATVAIADETKVGGHYILAVQKEPQYPDYDRNWHTIGATLSKENIVDGLDFYGEGNLLMSQQLMPSQVDLAQGFGNYGSLTWSPAPFQLKLEVKDYRHYEGFNEFQRPPTLEDNTVYTLNTESVSASRLYGQYQENASKTTLFASMLAGRDWQEGAPVYHGLAGAEFRGPARTEFEVKSGYRWLPGTANMVHGGFKARFHMGKGQWLELQSLSIYWNRNISTPFPGKDDRNRFTATYIFNERLDATLGYEYVPSNALSQGNHFFNASGTYKMGQLISRAFIGQTAGGVQCAGGVCRQVPAYSGAMFEASYAF